MDVSVRVTNLAQFSKALKRVDTELVSDLKDELAAIATPIASEVRAKVPQRSGSAAGSVKTRATMRGAAIVAGGKQAPYFQWLDFGGSTGRGHRPGVAFSGSIKRKWMGLPSGSGRYVYPTISAHKADTKTALGKAIAKAGRAAGFEVR